METRGVFHRKNDAKGRLKTRRAEGQRVSLAGRPPVGKNEPGTNDHDLRGWEPERPDAENSLRLLPSGSDRVGESAVRPTPARHMAAGRRFGKDQRKAEATARATDACTASLTGRSAVPPLW